MSSVVSAGPKRPLEPATGVRSWLGVRTGAVYALLVVLCAVGGYWFMFSHFLYDDEGFFDYTVKLFTDGHPMYTAVFSDYGPFYYEFFRGLFAITGRSVTTDAGRTIQLFFWIASSTILGVVAHRLTGRLSLGVAALATGFALMIPLSSEPMHAEALICFLLTTMVFAIAFVLNDHPRAALTALGVISAFLLLTKVNVGGYAIVAIAFAAVMAGGSLHRSIPVRTVAAAAFVLVGPGVMVKTLNTRWTMTYAALAVLSTVALAFVAVPAGARGTADESRRWPVWFVSGFAAACVLVLGILFILGTAPGDLFSQIVLVPARQATALTVPAPLGGKVIWWGLAAAVAAWSLRRSGRTLLATGMPPAALGSALFRGFAGLAILLSMVNQFPFAITPTAPFGLAMPLAWVAALPSARDQAGPRARLVRLSIPALAILQALLAYPVAGSQMYLGSILLVLCGVICLSDATAEFISLSRARASRSMFGESLASALLVAVAIGAVFQLVIQPVQNYQDGYREGVPLRIAGATQVHLPAAQAAMFNQIVTLLRSHCRTVATFPGMYSFNIWTRLPSPSTFTGQPFWHLLSDSQQQQVLRAANRSPALCLVRNDASAAGYQNGAPPPRTPLVAFYEDGFRPFARIGPYVLEVRSPA